MLLSLDFLAIHPAKTNRRVAFKFFIVRLDMIGNHIDKESTQPVSESRIILKEVNGRHILHLNLPKDSEALATIWQTDEYDFTVPDLEVNIDVESLHTAVRLFERTLRGFCTASLQNVVRIHAVSKES